jgi:hypothetical protein
MPDMSQFPERHAFQIEPDTLANFTYPRTGEPGVALILDIDFKLREQRAVADEVSIL